MSRLLSFSMSTAQFVNGNLFSLVSAVVNLFVSAELICSVKDFDSGDFFKPVATCSLSERAQNSAFHFLQVQFGCMSFML